MVVAVNNIDHAVSKSRSSASSLFSGWFFGEDKHEFGEYMWF